MSTGIFQSIYVAHLDSLRYESERCLTIRLAEARRRIYRTNVSIHTKVLVAYFHIRRPSAHKPSQDRTRLHRHFAQAVFT
jgi:hypothetical protein